MKRGFAKMVLFVFAVLLLSVGPASASLIYEYSVVYSGRTPSGTAPWMTATFEAGAPGTVNLTLTGVNLSSTEFVSSFSFNYGGASPITGIGFTTPWTGASAGYSLNGYKAGGAQGFDIQVLFPTSNRQDRFQNGDTAYLTIYGATDPNAFYATNAGPSIMGIYTGAHVQGIAGLPGISEGSGWAAVPIPPTVWLLGAGLLGLVAIRRGFLKQ